MKQTFTHPVLGIVLVCAPMWFGACSPSDSPEHDKRLQVVATTGMIADALQIIGGDTLNVQTLMGPGVDPHLYKASQGDLRKLSEADLVVYNGLHLEGKMGGVLEKLGRSKHVIALGELLPSNRLLRTENAVDPHIWFDVSLWRTALGNLIDSLTKLFPEHTDTFRNNGSTYADSLAALHSWVQHRIAGIPENRRVLITAHDAFGYFGRAYGIRVQGLQGISTVSDFGLRDITTLVDTISKRGVKAVFIETSVPPRAIEAVIEGCRAHGHNVRMGGALYSDAMGAAGSTEGHYTGMVRANVNTIVQALH